MLENKQGGKVVEEKKKANRAKYFHRGQKKQHAF